MRVINHIVSYPPQSGQQLYVHGSDRALRVCRMQPNGDSTPEAAVITHYHDNPSSTWTRTSHPSDAEGIVWITPKLRHACKAHTTTLNLRTPETAAVMFDLVDMVGESST